MPSSHAIIIKENRVYEFTKRIIDIVFSVVFLILIFPVLIVVSFIIKFTSSGPVFADTPERVGKDGKIFKMYKFRSMIRNAHQMLREDPKFAKLYNDYKKGSYKLKDDPRITSVGKIIRKYSIDEFPQFFNVLKGDMSIVGPRAYYADELQEQQKKYPYTKQAVKVVLSVKPGITGLWQVSGRSEINFDKRIQMDADYAMRKSVLFDFYIILKSPWAMLSGKGAL